MKKLAFVFVGLVGMCAPWQFANAISINPASNALADSENTARTIILRDASGDFAAGTITATTIVATSGVTLPAGSIDTTKITGTFIGSDIAAGAIDSTKLSLVANSIDTTKIDGTWLAADITANVIGTTKLLPVSATTADSYILCYTPNGGVGRCLDYDGGADTGKLCTCGAF